MKADSPFQKILDSKRKQTTQLSATQALISLLLSMSLVSCEAIVRRRLFKLLSFAVPSANRFARSMGPSVKRDFDESQSNYSPVCPDISLSLTFRSFCPGGKLQHQRCGLGFERRSNSGCANYCLQHPNNAAPGCEDQSSGVYSISPLPPGDYRVTAEHAGFQTSIENVTLTISQEVTINFSLRVGSEASTVTVNAGNILLNTTTAEISNVVDENTIKELPLNGRDPSSLVLLSPGTMNLMNTSIAMYPGSNNFLDEQGASVGGGQQGSDYALLDGVQNMDLYYNLTAPFPNADATQEFRTITSNFGAEYGFSTNAVISVSTKAGTNAFHGGAFEFYRDGGLNAKNWFSGMGNPLNAISLADSSAALSRKTSYSSLPTTREPGKALRRDDHRIYTDHGDAEWRLQCCAGHARGPVCYCKRGANQVAPSLLSPAAIAIAHDMLPLGQDPATGQVTFGGPPVITDYDEGTARIDYTLSNSQRLFVRNFIQTFNMPVAAVPGNGLSAIDAQSGQYYNEIVSHTWLPNPTFVNVLTAAWIRLAVDNGNVLYTNTGQPFCLSNYINIATAGCYMQGPSVNGGFSMVTDEPNDDVRVTWGLLDHITKTKGKHILTSGGDFMHHWLNTTTNYPAPGVFNFSGYVTGFGLADYVLGDVGSFYQGALENSPSKQWQIALYVQDQYKVKPNLTLTMGLRWEPDLAAISLDSGLRLFPGGRVDDILRRRRE